MQPVLRGADNRLVPLSGETWLEYDAFVGHLTIAMIEGGKAERELSSTHPTLIGRDPAADLVLDDPEVSSRHASIVPTNGGLIVEDLGSTNGTFVNEQRLSGTRQLEAGDRIQIGAAVFEVRARLRPTPRWGRRTGHLPPLHRTSRRRRRSDRPRGDGRFRSQHSRCSCSSPASGREASCRSEIRSSSGARLALPMSCSTRTRRWPAGMRRSLRRPRADRAGSRLDERDARQWTPARGDDCPRGRDEVQIGSTVIQVRAGNQTLVEAAPAAAAPAAPGAGPLPLNTIEVESLVKQFTQHRAVDGISLHVDPGRCRPPRPQRRR